MRLIPLILSSASLAAFGSHAIADESSLSDEDKALMDRVSVAYGAQMAADLLEDEIYVDIEKFSEAFKAASAGNSPVTEEEIQAVYADLRTYMQAISEKKAAAYKGEQMAFLEENKSKEGIKTTDSGLQYEILEAGSGDKPAATDQVTVHYTGSLTDGTVFDSSVERGQPATFGLNQVIKGWTEGVQLMPLGAKYRFYLPSEIGYGERGSPPKIPGGATLIFEVELLSIGGQ